tara:strand:- start:446 stop:1285 length:840 start_codon:yes stop_codon:yes gene_type:complete
MKYKLPITLIILTKNEDKNINNIMENTNNYFNQTIIVDSYSDDKTIEICKKYKTEIYQNKFVNQGVQFNWALDNCKINNDWVMRLDADEIMEDKLKIEISNLFDSKNVYENEGYFINRMLLWNGKWIKYGGIYPHYILRLFKFGSGRSEEITEEHIIINGKTAKLKNKLIENNLKNNIGFFTEKHMFTAIGEMKEYLSDKREELVYESQGFHKSSIRRKMKNVYYKFPLYFRALIYFFYRYIFLLGFIDGKEGFSFHFFQSFWYRMYIDKLISENIKND